MTQAHPLANFPFRITLKDGTILDTSLLSFTHGRLVSLSVPGQYHHVDLDEIVTIAIEDHSGDNSSQDG